MRTFAILASDIHLSEKAPVARSVEPNWFEAMARPLSELQVLSGSLMEGSCPIIYAGDIFDRWNSSPSLVNFAIDNLPPGYAIPGQHDLPNHSMEEIERSAYQTLVKARILEPLLSNTSRYMSEGRVSLHPFPWGADLEPLEDPDEDVINVAVIHSFVWSSETGYPGAPESGTIAQMRQKLEGYDVAHFGDNHKTTISKSGKPFIYNPGTFLRRKIDEINHRPQVGLLKENGTVEPYYLDISQDKFGAVSSGSSSSSSSAGIAEAEKFLEYLKTLDQDSLDFREAVNRHLSNDEITPEVKKLVLESIDGK